MLALLDDTQPSVRRALIAYFQEQGRPAAEFLRQVAAGENRILAWHARWFIEELRFSDPVAEFKGFIRSGSHDLEAGALLLCRVRSPQANLEHCVEQLDAMAQRCRELMVDPMSIREKCRIMNRVLFHEFGLRGNQEHFSDPLNSFVDQVLMRQKGIPITLSLIYLLVAKRLSLPLEPVGLPGHFVVGCFAEEPQFFLDTFEHGLLYSTAEVSAVLSTHLIAPKPSDFLPTPAREVLCRCCRNLVLHYAAGNDSENSRVFAEFVEEFQSPLSPSRT